MTLLESVISLSAETLSSLEKAYCFGLYFNDFKTEYMSHGNTDDSIDKMIIKLLKDVFWNVLKCQIGNGMVHIQQPPQIMTSKLLTRLEIRIFRAIVETILVLIYGSDTWKLSVRLKK